MRITKDENKFQEDLDRQHRELPGIQRGLMMNVYRDADPDCTNGGITKIAKIVLAVFVPQGRSFANPKLKTEAEKFDYPVFYVVNRHLFNNENDWVAYPTLDEALLALENKHPGCMFGGNFIYSSDSRKPFDYPIPVHDRHER